VKRDKFIVQLTVTAVAAAYILFLIVEDEPLTGVPKLWSAAVPVAWLVWIIFDRWAWRWPVVRGLAGLRPNIEGTWRGSLASEWIDPETGTPPDSEVYLVVRETFSTVWVRLLTSESKSETIVGTVQRAESGVASFLGVYRNVPRSSVLDRSAIHHGAVILDIEGSPPTRLDGRYWTERGSRGELRFDQHVRKFVDSHDEGRDLAWSR
jgi:hypothetical protein